MELILQGLSQPWNSLCIKRLLSFVCWFYILQLHQTLVASSGFRTVFCLLMQRIISFATRNTLTSSFSMCSHLISFCCIMALAKISRTIMNNSSESWLLNWFWILMEMCYPCPISILINAHLLRFSTSFGVFEFFLLLIC